MSENHKKQLERQRWNISRYVDTFETEAEIDIESISAELKELDKAILETDKTIAQFCKELGISTPL